MKKIKIYLTIILLLSWFHLYANDTDRKKYHFLVSTVGHINVEQSAREINNAPNFQFLYGLTNNFYFGLNYSIGENGYKRFEYLPSNSPSTVKIYQFSTSKNSETFSINLQYFLWKSIYSSINLGMEKGFTVERNNFANIQGNNITPQPFTLKTVFDDRAFGSIGLGIRQEIFSYFLLAFEYQRGYIESGKINQHFTYNPEYYGNNLPIMLESYLFDSILNGNKLRNSQFQQFYLSAGLAF
ncbi:hypothetical protein [Leptospira terpstrae]|uniref:Outer membrane protein beta-barrel domain-containing protein n=1 Tax=Leptospira terpstrae serovar Hualin str. LT 11-33 = ATCC 700639 TaxID=1257025 RepID=N1VTF9_9LEPT|nr:hypothetical protein [Leptospira terpstrae]EMY60290.1 hypothetical protein LEP1GSC203_0741 [Leptospira terpstrae serovar Hualin str. LT 11-33 = ATCC 700639]